MSTNLKESTINDLSRFLIKPVTCSLGDTIAKVTQTLIEKNIGCIVVVNEKNNPIGIFTERDFLKKFGGNSNADLSNCLIDDYMTKNIKTVEMSTSLLHGIAMMRLGKFRHLIAIDSNGELAQIVSIKDALDFLVDSMFG